MSDGSQRPRVASRRRRELVAKASTALANDLFHEALRIEDDLAAQAYVEILERHGQHVLPVQRTQGVDRWCKRAVVTDASETAG